MIGLDLRMLVFILFGIVLVLLMLSFSMEGVKGSNKITKLTIICVLTICAVGTLIYIMYPSIEGFFVNYGDASINDDWLDETYHNKEKDLIVYIQKDKIKLVEGDDDVEVSILVAEDKQSFKFGIEKQLYVGTHNSENNQLNLLNKTTGEEIVCEVWYKW